MPPDPIFDHAYAVIIAGGSGTRFWPLSRRKHPKQLLELFGRRTLLEQTVARIEGLIPPARQYIFTGEAIREEVCRRLPSIPREQIVAEPVPRNTAPAIGLAAHEIARRDPDALMIVLPADHVITKVGRFRQVLRAACHVAKREGRSVVIGVQPTRPDTGYGYVRVEPPAARIAGEQVFRVLNFTEKPSLPVARRFVASGRYFWNGGMFIWQVSTLLANLERVQPRMAKTLRQISAAGGLQAPDVVRRLFPRLEKISIDYALMEEISEIYAVKADIGWSDIGSWAVAYELSRKDDGGNVKPPRSVLLDSEGNMIVASNKMVAAVGVHDLVIVETDDALLVCARERAQEVGQVVQELERKGFRDFL